MSKKIQEYANDEISITFDPNICQHAAVCVNTLSSVFDIKNKPWVNVDGAPVAEIAAMIAKCPSGALKYKLADGSGPEASTASSTEINMVSNGPLLLAGYVVVKDPDGNVLLEGEKAALCRCGASARKPFCDGSHKNIAFEG